MSDNWFTTEGATGTLPIEYRNGSWFVSSSAASGEVKCLFNDSADIDESVDEQQLDVKVSSYKVGVGSSASMLILSPLEESIESAKPETESEAPTSSDENSSTATETERGVSETQEGSSGGNESKERVSDLKSFTGSGQYVTVEATVDSIDWVKKSESNIPDIKGTLTDDSVTEPVHFIVNEGVKHPYFKEGAKFRFEGVKDHYYTRKDQVQVVITEYTDFERLNNGTIAHSPSKQRSKSSRSKSRSKSPSKSRSDKSLGKIAKEKIGDKELTVSQEDDDSMVGRAKKEASRQQRDPAIDPRLRGSDGDDDE